MGLNYNRIDYPQIFKSVAQIEIDLIDQYWNVLKTGYLDKAENKKERLTENYAQDDEELKQVIYEELHQLDEVFSYGELLLILGLYRVVELTSKNIFKRYTSISNDRKLTNIGNQKRIFKKKTSKSLKKIPTYEYIDELRQLNNCIKHSGKVDQNLSNNFPRWTEGDKIKNVQETYQRLKPKVPEYLYNISKDLAYST